MVKKAKIISVSIVAISFTTHYIILRTYLETFKLSLSAQLKSRAVTSRQSLGRVWAVLGRVGQSWAEFGQRVE